jgi:TonB-linked SusC/RagA family outer membrane protein
MVPDNSSILFFSYIGYLKERVEVQDKNVIDVSLKVDMNTLNVTVVIGYGTQKKVNLTGAVDQIGSEMLKNRAVSNVTQMLQGTIPNLNITTTDGRPYRTAEYNIRGTTSIGEGGNALVLIDGVEGNPELLNPDDIASISVLKDASSAAIYGSRGAFGVILITTKNPLKDKIKVNYTGSFSVKTPTTLPDLVTDGYTYAKNFCEAYYAWNDYSAYPQNINKTMKFSTAWLDELKRRSELSDAEQAKLSDVEVGTDGRYVYYASTDWYKLLYKDHLTANSNNLSISGNSGKLNYYLSGRSYNQDGLFRYNTDDYVMNNLRAKGSIQAFDWLTVENNTEYSKMNYRMPMNVGEGSGIWRNMADEAHPVSPMFNPDGTLTYSAAYTVGDYWYGKNYMSFNQIDLKNTTGFTATFFQNKVHVKGDYTFRTFNNNYERRRVQVPYSIYEGETAYVGTSYNDFQTQKKTTDYMATNIYGEYENTFAQKHYFKGMVGYNYEQSEYNNLTALRNGLLFEDAEDLSMAIGESTTLTGGYQKWRVVGSFFRLNYIFDNRYLLEVNGRYDGSSKFPDNQQWGFFPSVSAGWRLSEEPFWHVNNKIISDAKIRASYGTLGNGNVDPYTYAEIFEMSKSGRVLGGALPQTTSNPAVVPDGLTWEKSTTANLGADIGFISGKLRFSGDAYIRKTTDMFTVGVTLPAVFGADEPYGNYADLTTKGFELTITWRDNFTLGKKPFNYEVRGTLADHHSVIDKYNNPNKYLSDYYVGQKVGEIWGYVTDGLFTSAEDVANSAPQKQVKASTSGALLPGDIKFKDVNGDGSITYGQSTVNDPGDRKVIGNKEPRYIYSFNVSSNWNNFFFSAFFQGVGKQNWYPSTESPFWGQYNRPYNNIPKYQLGKIWSEDNPNAYFPRYRGYVAASTSRELGATQTRYLQNVAYIRLKNIQFGYSLPQHLIKKLKMQEVRIYFTGENLWCWSPLYRVTRDIDVASIYGSDTDLSGGTSGDGYNYPLLKSVSLGLSVTF